jgi:hypothetical protein
MKPGSIKGLQIVVKDAQAAHEELKKRGVDISDVDTQAWDKFIHFRIRTATLVPFKNYPRAAKLMFRLQ